jgi:CBS domain-containing protein
LIEDSFLFKKIKEVHQAHVVTCQPWQEIEQVAFSLRESNASGAVVCDERIPIGAITDSDFRDIFAARKAGKEHLKAEDIMSSPVIKVDENDYVFEAIFLMAKHNIHRLVMTNEDGIFSGMITDEDIIALQTSSPIYFSREIENCETVDELKTTNDNIRNIVAFAMDAGAKTRDVVKLISHFNDLITKRAIFLMERDMDVTLPDGVTFLVLGSEGRMEQTLRTDQDNAMAFRNGLDQESKDLAEKFAFVLVDTLAHIGVPRCPGNTMASNPHWRRTESEWLELLDKCIRIPSPENLLDFGMFQDFRAIHGDMDLEKRLRKSILDKASTQGVFLAYQARNVCRFAPPLGWFDRFVLEKKGEHRGKINLKKAGIFTLTEGVTLLATEHKCWADTTWDKIDLLKDKGLLSGELATEVMLAFTFLVWTRLRNQMRLLADGKAPSDYIAPSDMLMLDQIRLKDSLLVVKKFIKTLRENFRVDMLGG